MIMPTICILKYTVLVLQTSIMSDRGVLDGRECAAEFGPERLRNCWRDDYQTSRMLGMLFLHSLLADDEALNIVAEVVRAS